MSGQETAVERACGVFERLDVNEDGELSEQEFVQGCLNDERLAGLLNTGSAVQGEEGDGEHQSTQ